MNLFFKIHTKLIYLPDNYMCKINFYRKKVKWYINLDTIPNLALYLHYWTATLCRPKAKGSNDSHRSSNRL